MSTAVIGFESFARDALNGLIDFSEGYFWIALTNTKEGTPAADDDSPRYQFSGNGPTSYNPLRLSGARLEREGDELVFRAGNVRFYGSVERFDQNPQVTHVTIFWAREGARGPSSFVCFFPVSWPNFDNDSVTQKITWNSQGIFRCSIEEAP